MWIRKIAGLGLVLAMVLGGAGCQNEANSTETVKVRLPLGYIPNIQFAPLYVAVDQGFFAAENIEVEFDYSFETDAVALVGANTLQFAVVSGEQVLLARAQGVPVVYVAAWYHDYPVAVVAKTSAGISTPRDLAGKKIGLPGLYGANYIGLRALLSAVGLTEADVRLESVGFNQVEILATDQAEAVVGYAANEPIQLRAMGFDLDVIRVADYVQLASNGLISNERTIANNPELVQRMVRALTRGVSYTADNPDEAYEISKGFVETLASANEAVQKATLATSIAAWQTDPAGMSSPEAWENMQEVLLEMGLLTGPLDLNAAFTNKFVEGLGQ